MKYSLVIPITTKLVILTQVFLTCLLVDLTSSHLSHSVDSHDNRHEEFEAKVRKSVDGRLSKNTGRDGRLNGFCNPKSITSYPPVICRDEAAECKDETCVCKNGYKAKYLFLDDRSACFVENGQRCQASLFVGNFGPQFEGPELANMVERWEHHVQSIIDVDEKVDNRTAERVKAHLRSWSSQVGVTFRPVDWGCISGLCDPKGYCAEGLNPVLMDNEADMLPVGPDDTNTEGNSGSQFGGYGYLYAGIIGIISLVKIAFFE